LREGDNVIVVAVEDTNGPGGIDKPVTLTFGHAEGTELTDWRISYGLVGQRRGFARPDYDDNAWREEPLISSQTVAPPFTWYRIRFAPPHPQEWDVPLRCHLEADGEALLYLNGRHIGRYSPRGPQHDFYLPEPYLSEKNVIAVLVRNGSLRACSVGPYEEFASAIYMLEVKQ
jgi:hypothetical protein